MTTEQRIDEMELAMAEINASLEQQIALQKKTQLGLQKIGNLMVIQSDNVTAMIKSQLELKEEMEQGFAKVQQEMGELKQSVDMILSILRNKN